jgi:electron transfer flavoprotein beta subunit
MNIVVCVKQVPDTAVERTLTPGDGTLDRASLDGLINELDEYAIEEGLKIAEAHGGEVTILSVGPEKAAWTRAWRARMRWRPRWRCRRRCG